MRSLEWATSERNLASLWRRCRSSASEAPSRASETCDASDSSESTSSRGMPERRAEHEQAARLVAHGERQEEKGLARVEAQLAPHLLGNAPSESWPARDGGLAQPGDRRPSTAAIRPRLPDEAATCALVAPDQDETDAHRLLDEGARRPRWQPRAPARARRRRPARRPRACSASSRAAARSSWRTRPTMRATTSRKRTAEAKMSTSRSVSPNACQTRTPGAIRHAPVSSVEPHRGQPRAGLERGLLERPHRGVQRGRAPEQVEGDPADVVAELVVVRPREQRVVVRGVDGEQARRCCRRGGRRPARASRCRPRGGSRRREAGCRRADRRPTRPSRARSGRRGGCSGRRGRPTRAARCRPR